MAKLRIEACTANVIMTADLNDTKTAEMLVNSLPIEGKAQVWGHEVYFEIPVKAGEENAHEAVPSGTLAYWPPGHAFCIFFGQTPYSPVNVIGKVEGDAALFGAVKSGDVIKLTLAD